LKKQKAPLHIMFRTAKACMFVARHANKQQNLFASGSKFVSSNKFQQFHTSMFTLNKVSIDLIKKLRADTDAPLGQCKKALEESVRIKKIFLLMLV